MKPGGWTSEVQPHFMFWEFAASPNPAAKGAAFWNHYSLRWPLRFAPFSWDEKEGVRAATVSETVSKDRPKLKKIAAD
jgi:hypothetical protein